MQPSIASLDRDLQNQVVARIEGRDVTRAELSAAFDWVANRDNWKLPIDCALWLSDRQRALVREAVVFFAGCKPSIEVLEGDDICALCRVQAEGYYAAVGA